MLETETVKTNLGHAHRMIQAMNIIYHQEKTEKLEVTRMLQEAHDKLEKIGDDPDFSNNRNQNAHSKEFGKTLTPRQLSGLRSSKSEIYVDDPDWEDQADTTSQRVPTLRTANEISNVALETGHGRGSETEDFTKCAEEFSGEADPANEAESRTSEGSHRTRPQDSDGAPVSKNAAARQPWRS
ncbi:hypothetical protein DL771_010474 [Monosporascus sp. 5C6A]|nr:hypothetical protein DL771_010474 [Monosporascus sp. 5C6A]